MHSQEVQTVLIRATHSGAVGQERGKACDNAHDSGMSTQQRHDGGHRREIRTGGGRNGSEPLIHKTHDESAGLRTRHSARNNERLTMGQAATQTDGYWTPLPPRKPHSAGLTA